MKSDSNMFLLTPGLLPEAMTAKLRAHLQAKHGDKLKTMSFSEFQKAKDSAQAELKAQATEKKAKKEAEAPPEDESKGEGSDHHVIVQMRKIADYKPGKYKVRVSPTRAVSVHSDTARKVSAAHDALKKPVDKRKFRAQLTQRLRALKEQASKGM